MKNQGESYGEILRYWWPEMVSSSILFSLPILIDSFIVSQLRSTSTYGTLGITKNFIHLLIKLSEALMIATLAIIGRFNGAKDYHNVGKTLGEAFWTTLLIGLIPFTVLFFFPSQIYLWLGTPPHMAIIGAPYLRIRAIGVLLVFTSFAFLGFMRGIKNTKTPMKILIVSITTFLTFDYLLVLGKMGFPKMGLMGSAIATVIQYSVMITLCIWHILKTKRYRIFFEKTFFFIFSWQGALRILNLSWPIILDKTALASGYVILNKMINPMGKYAIASFSVIQELERFALLPAISFATIITLLVSNHLGAGNPPAARANIRKILKLGGIMVAALLLIICINPAFFSHIFDPKNKFSDFVAIAFPIISLLVIFDFIQLILAGVLRGAGDVRAVMIIRTTTCYLFFYPLVSFLAKLNFQNNLAKFILIYGSFYLNTGIMGLLFILRLKYKRPRTNTI